MKRRSRIVFFLVVLAAVPVIIWTVWSNCTVGMTRYSVLSSRLPPAFHDYTIAVISDLHNAEFGEGNSQLLELIRAEQPDCIAITGDLVDSNRADLEVAVNLTGQLVKIAPCYYVTGNHEAWLGEKYRQLEEELLKHGVTVLRDESVMLEKDGERIQLSGLDDPDFTERDPSVQQSVVEAKLKELISSKDYCVLLSHRPELFEAYLNAGVDLVLSGHAHGGQFRLPFAGGLIAPNQGIFPDYDAGIYTEEDTTMVVSRGIGNSMIPVRFNNRPEVVCIKLLCG